MQPKYARMIEGLKSKRLRKKETSWFVYMLRCCDDTFYIGITNDLLKRVEKHNQGKAARYTKTRFPVELVYQETQKSRSHALIREFELKKLSRKQKETFVKEFQEKG